MDYASLILKALSELSQVFLTLSGSIKAMETNLRAEVEAMRPSIPPGKPETVTTTTVTKTEPGK